jgi:multidrug resistance efflux pump
MSAGLITEGKIRAAWRFLPTRTVSPIKLAIAVGCLAAAAYVLGPSLLFVESSQAVTNAPVDVVRSPIAGVVTSILAERGRPMTAGSPVAVVANDYWDPTALLDADNRLIDARRRLDEAHQEAVATRAQQASLRRDHELWLKGMQAVLDSRRSQAVTAVAAAQARLQTASTSLRRYGDLSKVGAVNLQRLDEVKLAAVTVGRELEGAEAELAKIEPEAAALAGGIVLASNDRPITLQRLDDIALRLARLDATEAAAAAEVQALIEQQSDRERQRDRETRIELHAASAGSVWRVFNAPGDRIAANSTVANLIDCSRTNVTAIFSQRDVGELPRGRRVSVRVAGFEAPLRGVIADVNGYYDNDTHAAEAVTMRAIEKGSVLVHVQLDSPVPGCLVGLFATVRLD